MTDHTDKSLFELRQYAVEKDREIERLVELIEKVINNESINYEFAAPAPYRAGLTVGHLLANQLVRDALAQCKPEQKGSGE